MYCCKCTSEFSDTWGWDRVLHSMLCNDTHSVHYCQRTVFRHRRKKRASADLAMSPPTRLSAEAENVFFLQKRRYQKSTDCQFPSLSETTVIKKYRLSSAAAATTKPVSTFAQQSHPLSLLSHQNSHYLWPLVKDNDYYLWPLVTHNGCFGQSPSQCSYIILNNFSFLCVFPSFSLSLWNSHCLWP